MLSSNTFSLPLCLLYSRLVTFLGVAIKSEPTENTVKSEDSIKEEVKEELASAEVKAELSTTDNSERSVDF